MIGIDEPFMPKRYEILQFVNKYPVYGPFDYAGPLPTHAYDIEGRVLLRSSPVWRTAPYAIPAKLPMFSELVSSEKFSKTCTGDR